MLGPAIGYYETLVGVIFVGVGVVTGFDMGVAGAVVLLLQ